MNAPVHFVADITAVNKLAERDFEDARAAAVEVDDCVRLKLFADECKLADGGESPVGNLVFKRDGGLKPLNHLAALEEHGQPDHVGVNVLAANQLNRLDRVSQVLGALLVPLQHTFNLCGPVL